MGSRRDSLGLYDLQGGELNPDDQVQESLWSSIQTAFGEFKTYLTSRIGLVLEEFVQSSSSKIILNTASIVGSVVSLLSSVVALFAIRDQRTARIATAISLAGSLTALCGQLAATFPHDFDWSLSKASESIEPLSRRISEVIDSSSPSDEVIPNSLDLRTLIQTGIIAVVSLLFAGLGFTGLCQWKDLHLTSTIFEDIRKSSGSAKSIANFILGDILGYDLDGDYPQCKELELLVERGSKLQAKQPADFISDPSELYNLQRFVQEVVKVTSLKMSQGASRRYHTAKQLLVELYRHLLQKLDSVNAILATRPRQVTIGLLLSGPPGHGKSEFGKYICRKVCEALHYPTRVYCLNKKQDGFYEPYGGDAIGVYNEFMALRAEDPILRDLNLICSSDPMNFEGASLDGKSQPCRLKIVFLTSNSHEPAIVRALSEGAVEATWDRLYHVAVEDPLCRGRHYPNPHRRPDFSHLQLKRVIHNSIDNVTFQDMSYATLFERLIGRVAIAERDYIQSILDSSEELDVSMRSSLSSRKLHLANLITSNQAYDDTVIPNAGGREFFITRLQGLGGTGKTTLASGLSAKLGALLGYPIQWSSSQPEFVPDLSQPFIYVLDDWLREGFDTRSFVNNMNLTHELSIFIITSNDVFKRVPAYCRRIMQWLRLPTTDIWDATQTEYDSGVVRRLGLQGITRCLDGDLATNEEFTKTFTFEHGFNIKDAYGRIGSPGMIEDIIFKSYRVYLTIPRDIYLLEGIPPVFVEPGVQVTATTPKQLLQAMRSFTSLCNVLADRNSCVKLRIADRIQLGQIDGQTLAKSWIVTGFSDDPEQLRAVWLKMCATYYRTYPNEALSVTITDTSTTLYFYRGVAYTYGSSIFDQMPTTQIENDIVVLRRVDGTTTRVTAREIVAASDYNQYEGALYNCSIKEYQAITRCFAAYIIANPYSTMAYEAKLARSRFRSIWSLKAHALRKRLTSSPVFWLGVALLGTGAIYGIIRGISSLLQPVIDANSATPAESKGRNPVQTVMHRMTNRNSATPAESKGRDVPALALRKMTPFRPNASSKYPEFDLAEASLRLSNVEGPPEIEANMLALRDMIKQPPSAVEIAAASIAKAYFTVHGSNGSCYAIHLAGHYYLTVSHTFKTLGEICLLQQDGQRYEASVYWLDRKRDLAILRCLEPRKLATPPTTRRYFVSREKLGDPRYGFFTRCGPVQTFMGGLIRYEESLAFPITSSTNENYTPEQGIFIHMAHGQHNVRSFVQLGDCGFPLLAPFEGDTFKIVGIHNGYNRVEKTYYSSYCLEDFDEFVKSVTVQPNSDDGVCELQAVELEEVDHWGLIPDLYVDAFELMKPATSFGHYSNVIRILGQSEILGLRSRPKSSAILLDDLALQTPIVTLPAAFSLDWVDDTSNLAVDSAGKPSPLFTQCLKYDARPEPHLDPRLFDEAVGLVMQECKFRYGQCRLLRTHEVINGVSGGALPPLDMTTSAGPLMKIKHGIHIKAPLFVTDSNQQLRFADTIPARTVRSHYIEFISALLGESLPPIIFSKDCAKVELLPEDKARKGKVRLFNEVDLSINLLLRKFFGMFQNKVQEQHRFSPIRMGQNPYILATDIMRQFNQIEGDVFSTDFSGFDKQLPGELIYAFCWIVGQCMDPGPLMYRQDEIYRALARSLTYVLHVCGDTLYLVDRGNESGTFVTTLLNSISVEILTMYTIARKWQTIHRCYPTLAEVTALTRRAVLGDDRTFKVVHDLGITFSDIISDSAEFGLTCTPAKTLSGIDFCSRAFIWDPVNQIAWPALKESSVMSQVRWYASLTKQQIVQNLDNAIFESALHPSRKLFNMILSDAIHICNIYAIEFTDLKFHSRSIIRERFVKMVLGDSVFDRKAKIDYRNIEAVKRFCHRSQIIDDLYEAHRMQNFQLVLDLLRRGNLESYKFQAHSAPVNAFNSLLRAARLYPHIEFEDRQDPESGLWYAYLTCFGKTGIGGALTRRLAKAQAYRQWLDYVFFDQLPVGQTENTKD